jgi:competence protein ComGC
MSDWLLLHRHTLSTLTVAIYTLVGMLVTLLIVSAWLTATLAA